MERLSDNICFPCMSCDMKKILDRLRQFEYLNMTPEAIQKMKDERHEFADIKKRLLAFSELGMSPDEIRSKINHLENRVKELEAQSTMALSSKPTFYPYPISIPSGMIYTIPVSQCPFYKSSDEGCENTE